MNIEPEINELYNSVQSISQNQQLQTDGEGGIINQGGEEDGRIYNQGAVDGSNETGTNTGRESQIQQSSATIDEYVSGGKAEILSGSTEEAPRRILINHTENSSVTFTEGTEDGTNGYKAYTAFVNAGIKAIYCQGPIERTVNGVTVSRTEAFTAPDGTVYISSESSLPPKQTFDHEKVHVADKTNNPAYSEYEAVLCNEADYFSNAYGKLASEINKNQFNNKYDIEDVDSYPFFMREIAAYINQFVLSNPEFAEKTFGGMFSDWGAVVEAVNKFNTDMGADFTESANFMPGGEQGGRERHHTTKAEQDFLKRICDKLGVKMKFIHITPELLAEKGYKFEDGILPDGFYEKDTDTLYIGFTVIDPVKFIFKHELTHFGEGTEQYKKFVKAVTKSELYKQWLKEYLIKHTKNKKFETVKLNVLEEAYMLLLANARGYDTLENGQLSEKDEIHLKREMIADFVGDCLFTESGSNLEALMSNLNYSERKNIIRYVLDFLSYLKNKLSKEKNLVAEISKLEDSFNRMLSEAVQTKNTPTENSGDLEFSINAVAITQSDIERNISDVVKMKSVAELSGQEFSKGAKDLVSQVDEYFAEFEYSIENSILGDVDITARGAKDSIAHGIGRNKAIAFAAVPNVIKDGKIIDYQTNWKNRGYDTVVLAAPVTINNQPYYEGVIVIRDSKTQRFYVHEVITEKRTDMSFKTGADNKVVKSGDTSSPSIISLLDKIRVVKEKMATEEVDNNNYAQENENNTKGNLEEMDRNNTRVKSVKEIID